jgi:RNA polymerase sigma-70 factor (ECF subfamily)
MTDKFSEKEFEQLVFENQDLILKVCSIYFNNQVDQEDLFQEIVINLWKGLPSFRGMSKLSTWIYRVSLNTALSQLRRLNRKKIFFSESIPENNLITEAKNPDADPRIIALRRGIDQLKPIEKAVILLYLEEKSYEEISEITGLSIKNVSVRIFRIKKKLEKLVGPELEKTY